MTANHDGPDQDDTDPVAAIRQHAQAILTTLRQIDRAHPRAEPITRRCLGNVDTLLADLAEYRHFLR